MKTRASPVFISRDVSRLDWKKGSADDNQSNSMVDDAKPGAGKLRSAVDHVAERFATAWGKSDGRQEIQDLAEDLVLDVVVALSKASIGEIAETLDALERRRKMRPAPAQRAAAGRARWGAESVARSAPGDSLVPGKRDPFDITMPDELLDRAPTEPVSVRREEDPPASGVRRLRRDSVDRGILAPPSSVMTPPPPSGVEEKPAARPPAIALREGEQLVRSSGSGVVIRRARTA